MRGKKGVLQGQGHQLEKTPGFHADGHKRPKDDGCSQILVAAILSLDFTLQMQIISLARKMLFVLQRFIHKVGSMFP